MIIELEQRFTAEGDKFKKWGEHPHAPVAFSAHALNWKVFGRSSGHFVRQLEGRESIIRDNKGQIRDYWERVSLSPASTKM